MPKQPTFLPVKRGDKWLVSIPPAMTATQTRVRKTFSTKTEAEKFASKLRGAHSTGQRGGMISATLAAQAREAQRILDGTGVSLVDAAQQAAARTRDNGSKEAFKDRYARTLSSREYEWRGRYLTDMERLDRYLPKWFMDMPCGVIDRAEIERALLDGRDLSRSTIDLRARMVMAILGHREKHRSATKIAILALTQANALLAVCENKAERQAVALLLWAGIRPDSETGEISRLQWEDIGAEFIMVRPEISKTGTDRLIPITPRLAQELTDHPKTGPVAPGAWKKRWQRIRKSAGITGQDVTRHTFASHYLAWMGEDKTKGAMGHTAGSSTLFRHYRRAVTHEAGEAFFQ